MIQFRARTDPKTLAPILQTLAPILRWQIEVSAEKLLFDSLSHVICNANRGRLSEFKGYDVSWEIVPETNCGEVDITID